VSAAIVLLLIRWNIPLFTLKLSSLVCVEKFDRSVLYSMGIEVRVVGKLLMGLGAPLFVLVVSLVGMVVSAASVTSNLEGTQIRKSHRCSDPLSGPVLGGVDLVALRAQFEQTQTFPTLPLLGSENYVASFGNYNFFFQSAANKDAFDKEPEEFFPQFGGYCSWGLTGYDIHVSDPSGYSLAGACLNSTNGFSYLSVNKPDSTTEKSLQNFWYLLEEAKVDLEQTGESIQANVDAARVNFATILKENGVEYCFNTELLKTCD
jgi:hypothetical protein